MKDCGTINLIELNGEQGKLAEIGSKRPQSLMFEDSCFCKIERIERLEAERHCSTPYKPNRLHTQQY